MKDLDIQTTTDTNHPVFTDSLQIRKEVFIIGQNIDHKDEVDDPVPNTRHFVGYFGDVPVTTLRAKVIDDKTVKLQRVSTLKAHRRKGYSQELIHFVSQYYKDQGFEQVILGAQVYIIPFYENLGFEAYGDEYVEAGIDHRMMKKSI